jgi:hypothetical protein
MPKEVVFLCIPMSGSEAAALADFFRRTIESNFPDSLTSSKQKAQLAQAVAKLLAGLEGIGY